MDYLSYFLRRAQAARARAAEDPNETHRRAWIEMAELLEGRCLIYMQRQQDRHLN